MSNKSSLAMPEGLDVSRETLAKLHQLVLLVEKWTPHINLVSANSLGDIWTRHVCDSLQLFKFMPAGTSHWVDLGSGGGFPGLVVSIVAQEVSPQMRMTFVESDHRKATFLRTAVRELGLSVNVRSTRIESTGSLQADVLSARALGPLIDLLGYAEQHLAPSGYAIFMKGRSVNQEIEAARSKWRFEFTTHASMTDDHAQILRIERISHA